MASPAFVTLTIQPVTCHAEGCGVTFGLESSMLAQRKEDGRTFYCPNGHGRCFTESEIQKLQKRLLWKEQEAERERQWRKDAEKRADAERRSAAAARGQTTRLRNRVHAGVCPECNRTFADVARHMKSKHEPAKA